MWATSAHTVVCGQLVCVSECVRVCVMLVMGETTTSTPSIRGHRLAQHGTAHVGTQRALHSTARHVPTTMAVACTQTALLPAGRVCMLAETYRHARRMPGHAEPRALPVLRPSPVLPGWLQRYQGGSSDAVENLPCSSIGRKTGWPVGAPKRRVDYSGGKPAQPPGVPARHPGAPAITNAWTPVLLRPCQPALPWRQRQYYTAAAGSTTPTQGGGRKTLQGLPPLHAHMWRNKFSPGKNILDSITHVKKLLACRGGGSTRGGAGGGGYDPPQTLGGAGGGGAGTCLARLPPTAGLYKEMTAAEHSPENHQHTPSTLKPILQPAPTTAHAKRPPPPPLLADRCLPTATVPPVC